VIAIHTIQPALNGFSKTFCHRHVELYNVSVYKCFETALTGQSLYLKLLAILSSLLSKVFSKPSATGMCNCITFLLIIVLGLPTVYGSPLLRRGGI